MGGLLATSLVLGGALLVLLGAIAFADTLITGATPVSLGVGATVAGALAIASALVLGRFLRR